MHLSSRVSHALKTAGKESRQALAGSAEVSLKAARQAPRESFTRPASRPLEFAQRLCGPRAIKPGISARRTRLSPLQGLTRMNCEQLPGERS